MYSIYELMNTFKDPCLKYVTINVNSIVYKTNELKYFCWFTQLAFSSSN